MTYRARLKAIHRVCHETQQELLATAAILYKHTTAMRSFNFYMLVAVGVLTLINMVLFILNLVA